MNRNEDVSNGNWMKVKTEIQKTWSKLSSEEIDRTKGETNAMAGLVEQKYGQEIENFQDRFSQITNRFPFKK